VRYHIIGDDDSVLGFGMIGVPGRAVSNAAQAEEAFKAALADGDVGIIIITERIADLIRPMVDRVLFTGRFPLVVEIPDRGGPMEGKLGIREMVNAAIGVKL
jgi:V/A-type H+/Na+-transporting ATPase subunit F